MKQEKTFQDLRNELQELSFKELHMMNITGETYNSNMLGRIINKLDREYGTKYERTETILKEMERAKNKQEDEG